MSLELVLINMKDKLSTYEEGHLEENILLNGLQLLLVLQDLDIINSGYSFYNFFFFHSE